MKKKVNLREVAKIKKMTSEFSDVKKLKKKRLIRRDKALLNKRLEVDKRKIQRLIKLSLGATVKDINDFEKVEKDFKKIDKIIDKDIVVLNSKLGILKKQIRAVSEDKERILKKKGVFKNKVLNLRNSLKVERGKRRVLKSEKLKV